MKVALKNFGRVLVPLGTLLTLLAAVGCGGVPIGETSSVANSDPLPANLDIIRPGDVVTVVYSGLTDVIPTIQDTVSSSGYITVAQIGAVKAAGMTRGELQNDITTNLVPRIYRNLTVTVNVNSLHYVYVSGQVTRGGISIPYSPQMTVINAIDTAGGFTDFASHIVHVTHRLGRSDILVNVNKARANPVLDLTLLPDDKIDVRRKDWPWSE